MSTDSTGSADPARSDAAEAAADDFAEFVTEHRLRLVRYAVLLTGSLAQAEDIVQDVLVRLMPRWNDLVDPLPYVRKSVTNEFLSWRRRWSTRNVQLADSDALDRAVEDSYDTGPDPQMWALLLGLTRPQRSALVLRYYEGMDDAEIAEVLSCRPATVRSHVHRGLAAIRGALNSATRAGGSASAEIIMTEKGADGHG